jgi:hypothetical protein
VRAAGIKLQLIVKIQRNGNILLVKSRGGYRVNEFACPASASTFCGQQDVLVENSCVTQGTRISFSLSRQEVKGLVEVIENCAKFYPIPVYIDGRKAKQKNFLEGAVYRRLWNGLEIGCLSIGRAMILILWISYQSRATDSRDD